MDEENKVERHEPASQALERRRPTLPASYQTVEMEEAPDLLAYWRVLRKRRWTILTIFFVLFTLVLLGTLKQKPVYRAKALLEIEKENPNILTIQELFELETVSGTYLETQYKILQSENLARRVIDQLGLDRLEEFNPPKPWWYWEKKEPLKPQIFAVGAVGSEGNPEADQGVLERFQDRLEVKPIKHSRLVEVSFESQDRALAAGVVNTLGSNYIDQNLEARWEATQKASEWLSQELASLKAKLEKSEDELQRYAREKELLFLESDKGNAENIVNERLRQLQEELMKAQALRYDKESLYRLVEAGPPPEGSGPQGGEYGSLPGIFEDKLMQELTVRLAELKREHAQLATTFTADYPRVKQIQNQINEIDAVLARERERAAQRIANDYQAARRREILLRQAFEQQQRQANLIAERSVQYNILKREVETNKQLYEGLLQRLKEAGVSAGLKASNIRIVDPADPPERPAKPRVALNLALAMILGLGLGVGVAFLQEYLDNTFKTSEDVERFMHLPALALIPSVESLNGRRAGVYGLYERAKLLTSRSNEKQLELTEGTVSGWYRIDKEDQHHAVLAEAFRSLRTSVLLSTAERPPRSLLITSAQSAEGKTTIAINLAISLAQLGQHVLLVDGDMRRPSIHKAFDLNGSIGLVGYLTGQEDWQKVVCSTSVAGLHAIPSGPVPPNPAELVSAERMRTLIRETMAEYSFVVLDSPPLLSVADSRILATLAAGVVLVVQGGATPREVAQRAEFYVREVGGNVIGAVLNNVNLHADDYYYSHYYHYHYPYNGHRPEERGGKG